LGRKNARLKSSSKEKERNLSQKRCGGRGGEHKDRDRLTGEGGTRNERGRGKSCWKTMPLLERKPSKGSGGSECPKSRSRKKS